MAYNGTVEVISGLKQKNNGTFPLVHASAVQVDDDDTRLDELLEGMYEEFEKLNNSLDAVYNDIEGTDPSIGLQYYIRPGVIISTNVWGYVNTYKHVSIPVVANDSVYMKTKDPTVYAFLKSNTEEVSGESPDFCDEHTTRTVMAANSETTFTVPNDCNYLYMHFNGNSSTNQLPQSLIINGVEKIYNIRSKIETLAPKDSPIFTGTPTTPTPDVDDNSLKIANTTFVKREIQAITNNLNMTESLFYNELNGTTGIRDFSPQKSGVIDSSGIWQAPNTGIHISLPVNFGDSIKIIPNTTQPAVCAFLKSDNARYNVRADFCDNDGTTVWQERKVINVGTTGEFIVPADCQILYIAVKPTNNNNLTPAHIYVNDIDLVYNIRKRIEDVKESIPAIDTTLSISGNTADAKAVGAAIMQKADKKNLDIWGMRKSFNGLYGIVQLPEYAFLDILSPVLYSDGYNYKHTIDVSRLKNISNETFTVTNQEELETAIENAASGDTIILKDGLYTSIVISKSLNLIGDGKVIFSNLDLGSFVETSTAGIYRTVSSFENFNDYNRLLLDISHMDQNIILPINKKTTIPDVVSNPSSFVFAGASSKQVYIHLSEFNQPTNLNVVCIDANSPTISVRSVTENATVYLENLLVFGGSSNVKAEDATGFTNQKIIAKNCQFIHACASNSLSLRGVTGYFQNCLCAYAYLDGFNYHINDTADNSTGDNTLTLSHGIEIDCIGHNNGYRHSGTANSDNGSTIHDGGKCVRIGCVYYNNKGGNVADISANTESYNYDCYAFDSTAPADTNCADFWANQGTKMHLYGCRADGNSQYNLWAGSNAEITVSKSEYTTTIGTITPE